MNVTHDDKVISFHHLYYLPQPQGKEGVTQFCYEEEEQKIVHQSAVEVV